MSDNAFLISDIDDSESDELSTGYRHDTINIPDQATNSDAYIDDNQRVKKSDSTIPNTSQNTNSKEEKTNNSDEDENNDDEDIFTMEKDENNDEEKESDEDIFLNESDEKNEEDEKEEKESDEDIFLNESDEKNEEEEKVEDNDIFLNKSDENNDDGKNNQDELSNKDNENNSDNEKMNKIIDDEEIIDSKDNEVIDKTNSEEDIKNSNLSNDKFSNSKEITDSNNNVSDEEENDDKKKNTSNGIDNVAESFFNADDEKEEHYDDNEFKSNKNNKNEEDYNGKVNNSNEFYESFIEKESDKRVYDKENDDKAYADEITDFADESNDFADDSNIGILRNDNLLDEMKNHDENKSNKDDSVSATSEKDDKLDKNKVKNETIKDEDNNKKENADTKIKDDSSTSKPIVEPPQKRNDHHRHHHRHSHDKKKEQPKKEDEEEIKDHEEENQQKEDIPPPKKDRKTLKKRKNNTDSEKQPEKKQPEHTIDEIVDISINDGDFSFLNQSNIEKVMTKMRQKQRDALENGDYELAEKAQLAAQSAIRYYNEKQLLKHNSNRACEINIQLEQTRNDISFLQEHWARVLENAKQKAKADLLQLRDEQDSKLKEFDDTYKKNVSDPENNLPIKYRKFSSTVLALKRKQEIYTSTNNFKLAKEINKEIKMLEEKEKKKNLLRYQKKVIAERNNMIKKQDEMFAVRKENWVRTIEGIRSVANYEIDHAKKSEKQLETKYMQTNDFSNKLIKQQQKRSSSLQPDKKDQKSLSTSIPNSPREEPKPVYHTQFTIQRNQHKVMQQEFRERAMINRIIYTNRVVPKVKKPIPMSRTKRQYPRTPR